MNVIGQSIARQLRAVFAPAQSDTPFEIGHGGLFEAHAVARRVHGNMATMMIGGVSALLMQMLHPVALAGVWDHSNFRADMQGRLRRTARFIGATTYGRKGDAEAAIARVRHIHERIVGVLPDGTPYSANDPAVLTWVHVAGSWSFLAAYRSYGVPLGVRDQNRYYAETAETARRLGADDVPTTRDQVAAYFERVRPELESSARTREVIDVLLSSATANPALAPAHALTLRAGADLLPGWARSMHGLDQFQMERVLTRLAAATMTRTVGWALRVQALGV